MTLTGALTRCEMNESPNPSAVAKRLGPFPFRSGARGAASQKAHEFECKPDGKLTSEFAGYATTKL
jgi:hypothetical protein